MFISVRLLTGYQQPLLYTVPDDWNGASLLGKIVRVPIRNTTQSALVIHEHAQKPADATYAIKPALCLEPFPDDQLYAIFINQLAAYYLVDPLALITRTRAFLEQHTKAKEQPEMPGVTIDNTSNSVTLTTEQQAVCDFVIPHITHPAYTPTLLHGVTGSGKTEIYKQLITHTIAQHKTVLLLLPEVTLARQFEQLLTAQLPDIMINSIHSGTGIKEKKQLWNNLLQGYPQLIIGVHLPVTLPISNLGLIIVDEEHEAGYQEKKHPKINSKEAAIMRAKIYNIPILLGSATPSIASLYNREKRGWHFFQLKKRFAGAFPQIKTVFLSDKKQRRNFWISTELLQAIKDRLQKKEQVIIFLNRRGISFFVQCKQCSFIFNCRACSVSLTLHEHNTLACHYCGYSKKLPPVCPTCSAGESSLLKKGIGTQRMVYILQELFPGARIARADLDTTAKKKVWAQTISDFQNGTIDILVGTQSITKGFHFPRVTLVGIIWADINLHFPHYAATEQTLQQLIQVAGRAGRQTAESLVIVQAMHDHPVFAHLNEQDYLHFYEQEIETRKLVGYPPYLRLAELELKHTNELIIEQESHQLAHALVTYKNIHKLDIAILGPAKPLVHMIAKTHRRTIYLKAPRMDTLAIIISTIEMNRYKSTIFFTPQPTH